VLDGTPAHVSPRSIDRREQGRYRPRSEDARVEATAAPRTGGVAGLAKDDSGESRRGRREELEVLETKVELPPSYPEDRTVKSYSGEARYGERSRGRTECEADA
jgi:hypothetical protein